MKRPLIILSFLLLAAVGWLIYVYGPFHYGTIARGVTPDGREYVIARTSYDFWDGWDVDYFVREPDGRWRRISAGFGWESGERIAKVVFDEPSCVWRSEGTPFLRLESGIVRYLQEDPDYMEFLPASLTPDDFVEWQRNRTISVETLPRNSPKGATPSPAESQSHAESAETAEPEPHAEPAEGAESNPKIPLDSAEEIR